MELINDTFLGEPLRLEGNMAGWQQLFWANQLVSQRNASEQTDGDIFHEFELKSERGDIQCKLDLNLSWQPFKLQYQVSANGETITAGERDAKQLEQTTPDVVLPIKPQFSVIGLASLGFKLLKSAKVVKVLFAGASVAAYSWLFSFQFALLLIGCLVFHEYGHIRAMKYFGIKTKGIYLIPFVGGLAIGENKINTRWQDVVISIMGPMFGLLLSIVALLLYWVTGEPIFAGLAAFNALLNLFNLLPILPLDGGHILKSITFSMHSIAGLVLCIAGALLGVFLSYHFGLALLGFLLAIGSIEIVMEWKQRYHSRLLPLDRYGQIFSAAWYVITVATFVAIIFHLASSGDDIMAIPREILRS